MNEIPALSRGEWFPSLSDCAMSRSVSPKTVDAHLRRHGHLERLGIGQGRGKRLTPHHRAKPVTIGPDSFASRREAARALGVSHSTICRWLDADMIDRIGRAAA